MTRQLVQSDVEQYRLIRLEGLKCDPAAFMISYEDWANRPLGDFIARLDEVAVFASFDENNILGMIGLEPDEAGKNIGWVGEVYVRPRYRRHGVARNLINHVVAIAEKKFQELRLEVGASNTPARDLYARNGFRQIDRAQDDPSGKIGSDCEILMSRSTL